MHQQQEHYERQQQGKPVVGLINSISSVPLADKGMLLDDNSTKRSNNSKLLNMLLLTCMSCIATFQAGLTGRSYRGMIEVLCIELQAAIHVLQHQEDGVVAKVWDLNFAGLSLHKAFLQLVTVKHAICVRCVLVFMHSYTHAYLKLLVLH